MTTNSLRRWALAIGAAALALGGCSTFLNKFNGQDKQIKRAAELQIQQLRVMRFADEYVGGIQEPIREFQAETHDPMDRLVSQDWLVSQATAAYTIATGPSAVANTLDMVVLATLSRMVVEDEWITDKYGARATPLRDAHRRLEALALELAKGTVTAEQLAQLQSLIAEWRARNPHINAVAYVHFRDFAQSIGHPRAGEEASRTGLFGLLGIDPLSGLDPAVRELAQSRELGERAIYYAQRMPNLLDMQVLRLADQFATAPETQHLLANADKAGTAAEAAGRLASELPGVLSQEREAAIRQFMDAINVESGHTRELVAQLRGALEAGTAASNSLNTTIHSFDQLVATLQAPSPTPPGGPPPTPSRPFNITEYTAAAAEISRAANQLEQVIAGINRSSPALVQAADGAGATLQHVIDHAYWRSVELLGILFLGGLGAALAYRGVARRWLT